MPSAWDLLPLDTGLERTRDLDGTRLVWRERRRAPTWLRGVMLSVLAVAGLASLWVLARGGLEVLTDGVVLLMVVLPWVLALPVLALLAGVQQVLGRPRRRSLTVGVGGLRDARGPIPWDDLPAVTLREDARGDWSVHAGDRPLARGLEQIEAEALRAAIEEGRPADAGEADEEALDALRRLRGRQSEGS